MSVQAKYFLKFYTGPTIHSKSGKPYSIRRTDTYAGEISLANVL